MWARNPTGEPPNERQRACPPREPQDRLHDRSAQPVAASVPDRTATLQPRFLESRLAYRVQELVFGGLKPETVKRLEALGERLDGGNITMRRSRADDRPIAGTRLIREYQGVEHVVTVRDDGFEWQGRPYRSLSAIARAIAGTRWNGLVFFGLKRQAARP